MSKNLLQKIRNTDNLPSLPTVAVEVLRLSRSDNASIDELVEVIQQDPALTGKILKTVNSALFSIPREIGSLKQAVSLLGLRSVKVMALSFSLVDTLRGAENKGFDFESYWRRSLSSAIAAKLIAKTVDPQQADEAFVAGLLCDLGMIAVWRCDPELYRSVFDACTKGNRSLVEVETEILGISHARLNRELLQSWSLPPTICLAVGAHHGEGLDLIPEHDLKFTRIIRSAAAIAGLFCRDVPSSELDHIKAECCEATGIDAVQLEEVLQALDQHVHQAASTLSLQVGQTIQYDQIQAEASAQLAQLSMQAEMERAESCRREQAAREQVNQLHDEKRAILEVASTDALTKIANRAAFDKRLDEEIDRARAKEHPLSLIMLDLDHFKQFNDTYGHQTGDMVLCHVAACVNDVVKHVGFAARYGGEEYAVIVAGKTAQEIREIADEIRRTIENRPVKLKDKVLQVTASLGAAYVQFPSPQITSEKIIRQADRNLYHAKHQGRNRIEM